MESLVIGKKRGCFDSKDGSGKVEYARLYVTSDFESVDYSDAPEVEGICCDEVKVPSMCWDTVQVGDIVRIIYNKRGRVEDVDLLEKGGK